MRVSLAAVAAAVMALALGTASLDLPTNEDPSPDDGALAASTNGFSTPDDASAAAVATTTQSALHTREIPGLADQELVDQADQELEPIGPTDHTTRRGLFGFRPRVRASPTPVHATKMNATSLAPAAKDIGYQYLNLHSSGLFRRDGWMPYGRDDSLCFWTHRIVMRQYILRAPPDLWQDRYGEDWSTACRAWEGILKTLKICGIWVHQCDMMSTPPEKRGWLSMYATTCLGNTEKRVASSFQYIFNTTVASNLTYSCRYVPYIE